MQQQAVASVADRLAEFFPGAVRMNLPVYVSRMAGMNEPQSAVIIFGTANEVLFTSEMPLEFNERVRLTNRDGSLDAEGKVVALQFGGKTTAVAVRFQAEVANWIVRPSSSKVGH